jgi:ATP-dependent protease ClpP protease subunit
MIHPTHYSPQFAYSGALSRLADAAGLEDARIEQIYSQHITLTPEQKAVHQVGDLWLGAEAAVKSGIATEIGDFSPPPGTRPYFI